MTQKNKPVMMKARGSSMYPSIKDGDLITVHPLPPAPFHPETGDIVAVIDDRTQNLVIHRIIKISGKEIITKGDFNFFCDRAFPLESVSGCISHINNKSRFSKISIRQGYKKIIALLSKTNVLTVVFKLQKKILRNMAHKLHI